MSTTIYNDLARTSVANTFTAAQTMSGARFLQAAGANVALDITVGAIGTPLTGKAFLIGILV